MSKFMKKLSAVVLCFCFISATAFGTPAFAADTAESKLNCGIISIFTDFAERIISIFKGSPNELSDVEVTAEIGAIFTENENYESSHASTLAKMSNGNIISAWFAGSAESNDYVRIWYSIYNGSEWSEPQKLSTLDNVAHWNPVLQDMGEYTRLYFKVGDDETTWVTKYVDTYDFGATWTESKELVPGDPSDGRGPVKNKCLVTSKGVMIAPASTEIGRWRAFFDISTDGGETWQKTDYVVAKNRLGFTVNMIQPTLWEDSDGVIHALFRTQAGWIYRSDSYDGGYTWSEAYPTRLLNNDSGIDCVTTDNGWVWLVYNPIGFSAFRNRLVLSVSKDNGETWQDVMYLENNDSDIFAEYSYPSIIAEGNKLYITYTYERETINYAFIEYK